MENTYSFPFTELLEELRGEIYRWLDSPTRLSLSLASTLCRKEVFPYRGWFNNWAFLQESIEKGYHSLVKYAYEHGSPIQYRELVVSVKSNQSAIAEWILSGPFTPSMLNSFDKVCRKYLCELAAEHGDEVLIGLMKNDDVKDLSSFAIKGGHYELARNLGEFTAFNRIACINSASRGNHFDIALRFCLDPEKLTFEEVASMFFGAAMEGHPGLMRETLRRLPATTPPSKLFEDPPEKLVSTLPAVLDIIAEIYPNYFKQFQPHFMNKLIDSLNVESLRIIVKNGVVVTSPSYKQLFVRSIMNESGFSNAADCTDEERKARFEFIQFLYECGARWTSSDLSNALWSNWATETEVKWLASKSEDGFAFPDSHVLLLEYLRCSVKADLKFIDYLLKHNSTLTGQVLAQALMMENNVELLDFLLSKDLKEEIEKACEKGIWEIWIRVQQGRSDSGILWPKSRPRYYNAIRVFTWFITHGFVKSAQPFEAIRHTGSPVFNKAIDILLGSLPY